MPTTLSVCLLTRDEERSLERALRSVEGVADEVVVVDTGSTDRTVAIAEACGARVHRIAWDDDFGAGRNAAIDRASGDWVLWLNPDEELEAESGPVVRSVVDRPGVFGYLLRVLDLPAPDARDADAPETYELRLFRRHPAARYVGRSHPGFVTELGEAIRREGLLVAPMGITLRRHGYLSSADEAKLRWALRLIDRELADRPGQLRYEIERAKTLLLLGDPSGHEAMAGAIEGLLAARDDPRPPGSAAAIVLEYVLNTPAEVYRGRMTPKEARDLTFRWFPEGPALLWTIAEHHFRAGQVQAAALLLGRLVTLGRSGRYDRTIGVPPRIVGPAALTNLAVCQKLLGQLDAAEATLRDLLAWPEDEAFAREELAVLDRLRGRSEPGIAGDRRG